MLVSTIMTEPTRNIITGALRAVSVSAKLALPDTQLLVRTAQRERARVNPVFLTPPTRGELVIPDEFKISHEEEPFSFYDSRGNTKRSLIFTTEQILVISPLARLRCVMVPFQQSRKFLHNCIQYMAWMMTISLFLLFLFWHQIWRNLCILRFWKQLWNSYDAVVNDEPRSDNPVEGWRHAFSGSVQNAHANIGKFINALKDEQTLIHTTLSQINNSRPPAPKRREKYRDLNERLKTIVLNYNYNIAIIECLETVAHTVKLWVFVFYYFWNIYLYLYLFFVNFCKYSYLIFVPENFQHWLYFIICIQYFFGRNLFIYFWHMKLLEMRMVSWVFFFDEYVLMSLLMMSSTHNELTWWIDW